MEEAEWNTVLCGLRGGFLCVSHLVKTFLRVCVCVCVCVCVFFCIHRLNHHENAKENHLRIEARCARGPLLPRGSPRQIISDRCVCGQLGGGRKVTVVSLLTGFTLCARPAMFFGGIHDA